MHFHSNGYYPQLPVFTILGFVLTKHTKLRQKVVIVVKHALICNFWVAGAFIGNHSQKKLLNNVIKDTVISKSQVACTFIGNHSDKVHLLSRELD